MTRQAPAFDLNPILLDMLEDPIIPFIKLLSMEQHGPLLRLIISIGDLKYLGTSVLLSDEYNIYNLVNERFKALRAANTYSQQVSVTSEISVKKHISAKDVTVLLIIASNANQFRKENIVCAEDWCTWISIGSITNQSIAVDLEVTLSKTQSVVSKKFYNDTTFTDFTLSGEDGSVEVHKAYLIAHSDPLMAMIHHPWEETKESCIKFKGVTRQTLQHFKEYMYLGSTPKHDEDLRALLLIAMQYLVEGLKAECMIKLLQMITAENLDSLVEFCKDNGVQELLRIIIETTPQTVLAKGYAIRIKKFMATENAETQETKVKLVLKDVMEPQS